MWKHEIIADLMRQQSLQCRIDGYRDGVRALLPQLELAHNIHLGDDLSYQGIVDKLEAKDQSVFYEDDFSLRNFPFVHNLFTFRTYDENEKRLLKFGIYVYHHPGHIYSIASMLGFVNKKEWILFPATYLCQKDGHRFQGYYRGEALGNGWTSESVCAVTHLRLSIVDAAMHIIGCRNVCLDETEPPEKLNRKRIKKGNPPLLKYYVLKFTPHSIKKNSNYLSEGELIGSRPLHICMGHHKVYTPEKPRFGRAGEFGRFWIQPHIRGDKKNGIVMKDYELMPGNREQ